MLRVCHLGKYYHPAPGGIEAHVRTLALAQAGLGLDVRVFCVNHRPGPTSVERDGEVEVIRLGRRASVPMLKLDLCPDLVGRLARADADILHLHAPNPTMSLALLRARPDRPLVITYHSDPAGHRVRGAAFLALERLTYGRAAAVMPTSERYIDGSPFLRRYRDRLAVVPLGLDLGPYQDPSAEDRADAARLRARYPGPLWLGCGRQVYYKGFQVAIRALERAPGTLLLIGTGPDRPALEALAGRLGLAGRVAFLGQVPRTVPYYLAADAFWFPSNARSEAFGLVQVEAMASGCPVINTRIAGSGVPWVCPDGETGLAVPVDDPAALAEAARRILDEPGLRGRLVEAGRRRAAEEFDHRVMAERTLAVYRRFTGPGPADSRPAPRPALAHGPRI